MKLDDDRYAVGKEIKKLRIDVLQCTQTRLAEMLGVTLSAVSKWEAGIVRPSAMAFIALARIDFQNKQQWLVRAGKMHAQVNLVVEEYKRVHSVDDDRHRVVHIYGSAGAGPNRFVPENSEESISLPQNWFKAGQHVVGLYVRGDSMAPLIDDGYLVLVDINDRDDLASLNGKVVAARDEHGVCIKWLLRHQNHFYLFSHNPSPSYPPIEVEKNGYAIVGSVIKWIGEVPRFRTEGKN